MAQISEFLKNQKDYRGDWRLILEKFLEELNDLQKENQVNPVFTGLDFEISANPFDKKKTALLYHIKISLDDPARLVDSIGALTKKIRAMLIENGFILGIPELRFGAYFINFVDSGDEAKISKVIKLTARQLWFLKCAIELKAAVLPLSEIQLNRDTFEDDYGITQEEMLKEIEDLKNKLK